MEYQTSTFYLFTPIDEPFSLVEYFRELCGERNLLGRVLVGREGVNAGVSGRKEDMQRFRETLTRRKGFEGVTFRTYDVSTNSYHKLVVRVRDEVVVLGEEVDVSDGAEYVSPARLKEWYERGEDFIILDTRNEYEAAVGRFKGARVFPIKRFRELPKELETLEDLKDKKIVTYCTGGIRCEKVTPLMKKRGFTQVFQLKGGIIDYVQTFPGQEFEGDLFVFDDRLVAPTGSDKKLGSCAVCSEPCNAYTDCHNLDCDKLFICCDSCKESMKNTCSEACKVAPRRRV